MAQPVIQSFSPELGPVGTIVTINGSNFGSSVNANIVFFGAVKAQVATVSTNSLTVIVPIGASFQPLSITTNGLTGYAQKPFVVTFSALPAFTSSSFEPKVDWYAGSYPNDAVVGDLDGDGKPDVVVSDLNTNAVSIFRNTSIPGMLSFAPYTTLQQDGSIFNSLIRDLDGDGKPDLIITNYSVDKICVYKNTSVPGTISFGSKLDLVTNTSPHWLDAADFNADGKPDIMTVDQNSNKVSIFRNTSGAGNISFAPKLSFTTGARPIGGQSIDLDGDLLSDIAVANMDDNTVSILRNTSMGGNISFATKVDFATGDIPFNVTLADIDGDGKKDICTPNSSSHTISILKNTSIAGTLSFLPKVDISTGTSPLYISAGDLSGDGKPDIAVVCFNANAIYVYKNISLPGTIALGTPQDYITGSLPRSVPLCDMDGDGRMDMTVSNSLDNMVSVFRNNLAPQLCAVSISTYAYHEDFENGVGGWTPGGINSDWTLGNPAKPVINNATGGNNCWVTGELDEPAYNDSELSWLLSPCFDFSSLQYPQISFKIFWESERKFDGATMQYSTDGGDTWAGLGSTQSNSNCEGGNWYNNASITYLNNAQGWSGNIQSTSGSCQGGQGSGGWLTAKHSLAMLAGKTNVRFRFLFGSGSICNAFDGFAIDDIDIREAPANTLSVTSICNNDRQVTFSSTATCARSYSWDFGDAISGTNNTATTANPQHIFSGPGTYTIALTTNFVQGPPATFTKEMVIIGLTQNTVWPGVCSNLADAGLSVTASGSNTAYSYTWNTTPPQYTPAISGIGPGTYTVSVNALNGCSAAATFVLPVSTVMNIVPSVKNNTCNGNNGAINLNVTGGTSPYQYLWSTGATTPDVRQLTAGNFDVSITDANGCNASFSAMEVKNETRNVTVNLGPDLTICSTGQDVLRPGDFAAYLWQDHSTQPSFTIKNAGAYYVKVTDADGCTGSDTMNVVVDCADVYFPTAFTPGNDPVNKYFGPVGDLGRLTHYTMSIYNRYGQLLFRSQLPTEKWDGSFKGVLLNTGSFVWMAHFKKDGKMEMRKGTVLLLK